MRMGHLNVRPGQVGGALLAAVILLTGLPAMGQSGQYLDPDFEPAFYPVPENIRILQLENGLEVILMRNPGQPMAAIYTQVKVGSAREDYRTSGMSHMLEHLLFNGSEKYTQEEQYELADRAGAYNNANTTDFYTNYMMVVPAAELETGLDLQSQMLFHSLVPAEKFAKEQGIVLGELVQARDWPGHDTQAALRQVMFQGSSLELPTLGTRSTIENLQRDDVYAFYKTWYVPNNMTVTVAGNFDEDRILDLLETYFGAVAPGTLPTTEFRPAALIERTRSISRRVGDQRVLALSFAAPVYGMADYFPFLVMTNLLELEGSGILTRALEDLEPDVRPELSSWWSGAEGFGRLVLEFTLKDGTDPGEIYRLVQDAVTGAVDQGVVGEDILGIVRMSETATLLEREQLRMTGIYIAEPVVLGGADFFVSYLERLRGVTAEDVTRALTNWLVDAPCEAVLLEPAEKTEASAGGMPGGMQMPAGMKMPPAMAAAMAGQVKTAEKDEVTAPPGYGKPAVPIQVDRTVLENGAVLVSQTNPDSPIMAIHLTVRGRAQIDRDNAGAGALDLVHRLFAEGYAGCDRACLARELRRMGAKIKLVDDGRIPMDNYYTNGRFSFVRIETAAEYGPAMLELLVRKIQHASFTSADFERVRDERVDDLTRLQATARRTANGLLNAALYGDHPLVLPPEGDTESLGSLDFNQLRLVYRKAFSPGNLIFSIVGPVAHDDLRAAIEEALPGRGNPTPPLPALPVTTAPKVLNDSVGGEMAAIRLGAIMDVDPAQAAALRLTVAILSDRLAMDLRESRGLSYSVGASLDINAGQGEFNAWLNPPVERKAEGLEALKTFLAEFDPASITQEDLDRIRSARTGRMMMRRLSSMGQAYYLAMAELENDLGGYLGALDAYDSVTLADVTAATDRYLKTLTLVEVVVD